jgi:hypothetical protein
MGRPYGHVIYGTDSIFLSAAGTDKAAKRKYKEKEKERER